MTALIKIFAFAVVQAQTFAEVPFFLFLFERQSMNDPNEKQTNKAIPTLKRKQSSPPSPTPSTTSLISASSSEPAVSTSSSKKQKKESPLQEPEASRTILRMLQRKEFDRSTKTSFSSSRFQPHEKSPVDESDLFVSTVEPFFHSIGMFFVGFTASYLRFLCISASVLPFFDEFVRSTIPVGIFFNTQVCFVPGDTCHRSMPFLFGGHHYDFFLGV